MSILEIKNLSHRYEDKPLIQNASLTVNNGEHLGIVGLNGAGKSTFIKILSQNLMQDEGEIKWGNVRKGYLDQYADIDRTLTVMEYLKESFNHLHELNARMEETYSQMGEVTDPDALDELINKSNKMLDRLTLAGYFELDAMIKKVANGLGVDNLGYDTVIEQLSGGGRAKLMLARLLLEDVDIMLLDEPTNFLDVAHVSWLIDYLNAFKGTFLVISHDTLFLNRIAKGIVSIENFTIRKYSGTYDEYLVQRQENEKQYADKYASQQREIEKLETYIAKNKARAATAGMANSRQKRLEKMEIINKPLTSTECHFAFPVEELHTKDLLIVRNLSIGYSSPLLPPIDLTMDSETKLWIRGTNGVGKTTLVKTLLGILPPLGGTYRFHIASQISYLEQDLIFDDEAMTAVNYFSNCYPRMNVKEVRTALSTVGIKGEMSIKPMVKLSGGEMVRVKLSTLMFTKSNVLILDEPTNHLDIKAKTALQQALIDYKGAVILVSHESDWAESIATKILDVKGQI